MWTVNSEEKSEKWKNKISNEKIHACIIYSVFHLFSLSKKQNTKFSFHHSFQLNLTYNEIKSLKNWNFLSYAHTSSQKKRRWNVIKIKFWVFKVLLISSLWTFSIVFVLQFVALNCICPLCCCYVLCSPPQQSTPVQAFVLKLTPASSWYPDRSWLRHKPSALFSTNAPRRQHNSSHQAYC